MRVAYGVAHYLKRGLLRKNYLLRTLFWEQGVVQLIFRSYACVLSVILEA